MVYDLFVQVMVDYVVQGMILVQIVLCIGMDIEVVYECMNVYLESQVISMFIVQMCMFQFVCLERILGVLWQQVMDGDFFIQGCNVKNLIEVVCEIIELMDLKKDCLCDEQIWFIQVQIQFIIMVIEVIQVGMLEKVVEIFFEELCEVVEMMWGQVFFVMVVDVIVCNKVVIVKVGGGVSGLVELELVLEEFD